MSTVEVEILGNGAFAGSVADIVDYSVTEYASPTNMDDLNAGVGSISFDVLEDPGFNGSMLLPGQPFELRDPRSGRQRGVIDGGTSQNGYTLSVEANTALLPLVSIREIPPYSGSLGGALLAYLDACGVSAPVQFDPDLAAIPVALPRSFGDVWTQVKKLQAIHQFELADVGGVITMRKLRLREVDVLKYESTRLDYGRDEASQIVEVYYYNNERKVNAQVCPRADEDFTDRAIISVDAGQTITNNYPVDMWVESIDPPQHILNVPWETADVNSSVYSVVDKDGQPVTVFDWQNGGGYVAFGVGEDGKSVDVAVRGMSAQGRAPYRIAGTSEDREYQYGALFIAATGVTFKQEKIWSHTGAALEDAPSDEVTRIDDPSVSTRGQAATVLMQAIRGRTGIAQAFSATSVAINRRGETGQPVYLTFGEWDAANPVLTFTQFDALHVGETFREFDASQEKTGDFDAQAFGGVAGARVRHRGAMYRIRDNTSGPGSYSWTSAEDTLFSDWEELAPDAAGTFGDFDAKWTDKTFEQHARMPLA